jgi:hypothetical protein
LDQPSFLFEGAAGVGLGGLGIDVRETKRGIKEEFVTKFVVRAMAPAGSAARLGVVKVHAFVLFWAMVNTFLL